MNKSFVLFISGSDMKKHMEKGKAKQPLPLFSWEIMGKFPGFTE